MSTMTLSEWCSAMRTLCEDAAQRLGARVRVRWSHTPEGPGHLDIRVRLGVKRPRLEVAEGTPAAAAGHVWGALRIALRPDRDADLLARREALSRAEVIADRLTVGDA